MAPQGSHNSGPLALFAVASLLLTFFVALVAMSEREQGRARDIANSFAQRQIGGPGPATLVPVPGDTPAVRVVERRWIDLFPGAAANEGAVFGAGRVLNATLGAGSLFMTGLDQVSPSGERLFASILRLMSDAPPGLDLALDVKLGVGAAPSAEALHAAVRRAGMLARLLNREARGGEIGVGVDRGAADTIGLELRLASRPIAPRPMRPDA